MIFSANTMAFLAVAELGTVHAAARELSLTQSAVTMRLQNLEREVAASLFLRSRRGMALTEAGKALLVFCRSVQRSQGELLSHIAGKGSGGPTRITVWGPSSLTRARVAPALAKLHKDFPSLLLQFQIDDRGRGIDALKSGVCDIALVRRDQVPSECDSKRLATETYRFCIPKAWEHRTFGDIVATERFIDFDAQDTLTFDWLAEHKLISPHREHRLFANNSDVIASLVAAGAGYALLTQEFVTTTHAATELVLPRMAPRLDLQWAAAWYPRAHTSPLWQAVIKALR